MSITAANPTYHQLQAEWRKRAVAAQQALHELQELQIHFEKVQGSKAVAATLTANEREHLDAIVALNLDDMSHDILEAEVASAEFLEDGDAPTPPPGFVDEDESKPLAPDSDKNRRDLNATIQGTLGAFRELR